MGGILGGLPPSLSPGEKQALAVFSTIIRELTAMVRHDFSSSRDRTDRRHHLRKWIHTLALNLQQAQRVIRRKADRSGNPVSSGNIRAGLIMMCRDYLGSSTMSLLEETLGKERRDRMERMLMLIEERAEEL